MTYSPLSIDFVRLGVVIKCHDTAKSDSLACVFPFSSIIVA